MRLPLIVFSSALLLSSPSRARIWFVDPGGSGDAVTISAGIDSAAVGDTVLIACGTYLWTDDEPADAGTLYRITSDLHLASETADPVCVRIDAEGLGRILAITGATDVTVRGITFDRGSGRTGGAVDCTDANVTLDDCRFERSSAGGAMCGCPGGAVQMNAGELRVFDSVFTHNQSGSEGGAIGCHNADLVVEGCSFSLNRAYASYGFSAGGAIAGRNSSMNISGSSFAGNEGRLGGAVFSEGSSATRVESCEFVNNRAFDSFAGKGGAIHLSGCDSPVVVDCDLRGNEGDRGGGIYVVATTGALIEELRATENAGELNGGAILLTGSDGSVRSCTLWSNTGGARGGGIYAILSDLEISTCTLASNRAVSGSGVHVRNSTTRLDRLIVYGGVTGGAIECEGSSSATLICSDLYLNEGGDWIDCVAGQLGVSGNIRTDPLFCGANVGDFSLQEDSPCLPGNHPDGDDCQTIGARGHGCGPVSVDEESWSGIKGRFR